MRRWCPIPNQERPRTKNLPNSRFDFLPLNQTFEVTKVNLCVDIIKSYLHYVINKHFFKSFVIV
jgi:hypothetical protein